MKRVVSLIIALSLLLSSVYAFASGTDVLKVNYDPLKYNFEESVKESLKEIINPDISDADYLKYKEYENIHPRLFVSSDELSYIKENSDEGEAYYYLYSRAVSRGDNTLTKKMPGWPQDGKNTTSLHRATGDNLATLAVAYLLTSDTKYYNGAEAGFFDIKQAINEVCVTYPSWGVEQLNNDLVFDHISVGLSLVWDYCQDILTDDEKELIVSTIKDRMEYALDKTSDGKNSNYGHNHSVINRVALSVIGLAMFEELTDIDGWMKENLNFLSLVPKTMSPDGSYHEGIMYQDYTYQFLLPFADLAKKFHNVDLISDSEHFKNYKYFLAGTATADGTKNLAVPFNNSKKSHNSGITSANASFLADWFNDEEYQSIANWFMKKDSKTSTNTVWYEIFLSNPLNDSEYDFTKDYKTTAYFENSEILTIRKDWQYGSPMLAAKCNPPLGHMLTVQDTGLNIGSGHAEPDVNHFTLLGYDNEYLFYDDIDFGYENTVTGQHNTLLVDGKGQKGDGETQFMDKIQYNYMDGFSENPHFEKIVETEEYVYFVGSGASAYPKDLGVSRFNRHFLYFKTGDLVIIDDIALDKEKEMTLRYLPNDQNIEKSGTTFISNTDKNKMKIYSLTADDTVTIDSSNKTLTTNFATGDTIVRKTIDYKKTAKEWVNAVGISFDKKGNNTRNISIKKDKGLYLLTVDEKEYYIDLDDYVLKKGKNITPFDLVPSEYNSIAYSTKQLPSTASSASKLVYAKSNVSNDAIKTAGIAKFDLSNITDYEYGVTLTVQSVIYSSNHDAVDFEVYYVPDSTWTQTGMQEDITTTPGYMSGTLPSGYSPLDSFEYVGRATVTGKIEGSTYNYQFFDFDVTDYVLKSLSDGAASFFFVAKKNPNSNATGDPQVRIDFNHHIRGAMHLKNVIPDASIKEIKVNNALLSDFSSDKYNYEIFVNDNEEFPEITAIPNDSKAKITVTSSGTIPGYAIVSSEAADGASVNYSIRVKNIIQKTDDYTFGKLPIVEYTKDDDSKVTATVNKKSLGSLEDATFIFTAENGKVLKNIKSFNYESSKSSPSYNFDKPYEAIKTYIWDSYASGKILLNSAVYGSTDAGIEKIYINGEEFTKYKEGTSDYTLKLPGSALYYPYIDVVTKDSSSKVDITYPKTFPGTVSLKVTSSGGVENTLLLTFEIEEAVLKDYIINYNGGVAGTITKITDLSSKSYYGMSDGTTYYLEDIPEELLGAYTLSYTREAYNQSTNVPGYHSFKINRSATVYVFLRADSVPWIDETYEKVTFPENPAFGWFQTNASTEENKHQTFKTLYKKRVDVSEFSEEECTVNLPGQKCWYTIMVKFD